MSVKRFSTGGPGKKQCPACKGDFFANAVKVCPDCGSPFKKDGDLPGQKQLPLVTGDDDTSKSLIPVEHSRSRRKPEVVKTFTVKELLAPVPKGLTIQEMADYVRAQLAAMGGHYKQIALHTYYLGLALNAAIESFDHGEWGKYLKEFGMSETTAWRARELAQLVKSPDELSGLSKTEAYRLYGILPPPKQLAVEKLEGGKEVTQEEGKSEKPADEKTKDEDDVPPKEEVNIPGDKLVTPEAKVQTPEKPSESGEVHSVQPSVEKQSQPEVKVALEDVTEAEMDAFSAFVEVAGSIERAKAVFQTCCKANAELDAD